MDLAAKLEGIPLSARKLLCVIAREIYNGPLRSKNPGTATMPEIHEACGLDVDQMDSVVRVLQEARLISVDGDYPFEEIRMAVPLDDVVAELQFDLLK
jgi:hypothetical protein